MSSATRLADSCPDTLNGTVRRRTAKASSQPLPVVAGPEHDKRAANQVVFIDRSKRSTVLASATIVAHHEGHGPSGTTCDVTFGPQVPGARSASSRYGSSRICGALLPGSVIRTTHPVISMVSPGSPTTRLIRSRSEVPVIWCSTTTSPRFGSWSRYDNLLTKTRSPVSSGRRHPTGPRRRNGRGQSHGRRRRQARRRR